MTQPMRDHSPWIQEPLLRSLPEFMPLTMQGLDRKDCRYMLILVALGLNSLPQPSFTGVRFQERLPAARPKLSPETSSSEAEGQGDGAGDAGRAASESKAMGGEAAAGGEAHLAGWEELAERGRDFNVDLIPKLSLSAGPLVASLLKSGVGRYLEFMPLQSTFIHLPVTPPPSPLPCGV